MYTIRQAAALTGIPAATLRAWERRYAVVAPARSDGGYRLYDEAAIRALEVMAGLVALGHSPQRAALEVAGRRGPGEPGVIPAATAAIAAVDEQDLRALSRASEVALAAGPLPEVIQRWLMPLLDHIGREWAQGRLSIAAEHAASHVLMRVLAQHLDLASTASTGPPVLVGLPRGARHELGALAFAAVAAQHGIAVAYLGADLPADDWVRAAADTGACGAVVAVPLRSDVRAARETVTALTGTVGPTREAAAGTSGLTGASGLSGTSGRTGDSGSTGVSEPTGASALVVAVGGGAQDGIRPPAVRLGHDLAVAADRLHALVRPRGTPAHPSPTVPSRPPTSPHPPAHPDPPADPDRTSTA
ncbi:MAG: MerR family transcriptional regulator [Tetrasphaera sp.]|nr:MerR family transcriptional regulator [Tetrasphaera sp.]